MKHIDIDNLRPDLRDRVNQIVRRGREAIDQMTLQEKIDALNGMRVKGKQNGPAAFVAAAQDSILSNPSTQTRNGALSNATTLSATLDFFSSVLRGNFNKTVHSWQLVRRELKDNEGLARRLLFQLRDARGGKGERDAFRSLLTFEATNSPAFLAGHVALIPEYGRWDDVLCLLSTPLRDDVIALIKATLINDLEQAKKGEGTSLLAKWLPSENAGKESAKLARSIAQALDLNPSEYRRILSALRGYIGIVERKMSANEWQAINYEKVSSRAMFVYKSAFRKRDGIRYEAYLEQVKAGTKTIHAGRLDPHEILGKYGRLAHDGYTTRDATLEALWSALPGLPEGTTAIVPMIDVSGSMEASSPAGVSAMTVALALGIYLAQRNRSAWAGHWFSFSSNATLHRFNPADSLLDIVSGIERSDWQMNTDFQRMFETVLKWYDSGKITKDDIPNAFVVFSDMQFDVADRNNKTNLQAVRTKFTKRGLVAPTLVFWQVTGTSDFPAVRDDIGAILLSGFNTSMLKGIMAMDVEKLKGITPERAMLDILFSERYDAVG